MSHERPSKIHLPTVETCHWRSGVIGDKATCGLVASLYGPLAIRAVVNEQQCQACCLQDPPTPSRINSVVASVMISHLNHIDSSELTAAEFECRDHLLGMAERALANSSGDQHSYLPARSWQTCRFLGEPLSDQGDSHLLKCSHPAHQVTTHSNCERCHDWSRVARATIPSSLSQLVPSAKHSKQIAQWAVGITTAPRTHSTLGACVQGLIRAGWNDCHLFLDGSVRVPQQFAYMPVTWREHSLGASPAWYLALSELVARNPHADAYALFQDDAFVHYGDALRDYLERVLWLERSPALVTLYNPGIHQSVGWHKLPDNWDWGTLAVIFPPELARSFLSDTKVVERAIVRAAEKHLPIPELLREWQLRKRIAVWCPYPSLVQHIGQTSSIWPHVGLTTHRTAPLFSADLDHPLMADQSLADFPESAYTPSETGREQYIETRDRGYQRMRQSRVAICGLCRDVSIFLPRTMARIERLMSSFGDAQVVLFENDSSDGTREQLNQWASTDARITILGGQLSAPKFETSRSRKRATALAHFRNQYLNHLRVHAADFTHVIVLDADLIGGWSYDGIAHTFGNDQWDFVGSYGLNYLTRPPQSKPESRLYDSWAFRPRPDMPASVKLVEGMPIHSRGSPMIPVLSCFGGLGIYKSEAIFAASYDGQDCEHVLLHTRMREAGYDRLFINPNQITLRTAMM